MFIDFKTLRDAGWHVEANKDGVLIQGDQVMPFVPDLVQCLRGLKLSDRQTDLLVDGFAAEVEGQMIFNVLTGK